MVTFISQCQKNALKKTRRVLDAFAERIGDNTWQTVITEEGLEAVKKLLQKTASKNTAVSCHWIRSRARSEFLWAVGNKDKFDERGKVPVNYTSDKLKLDERKIMVENAYANTQKQPLDQHLFAVGFVSYILIKQLLNDDKLAVAAFFSGSLHDIGKLDPEFQSWIMSLITKNIKDKLPEDGQHIEKGKFTFEDHARHNEISLFLYHLLDDSNFRGINSQNKDLIKNVIYWHHAKPIRKNEFTSLDFIYKKLSKSLGNTHLKDLFSVVHSLIISINKISNQYNDGDFLQLSGFLKYIDDDKIYGLEKINLPNYKYYSLSNEDIAEYKDNINTNSKKSIVRAAVISADRLVSSLTKDQLTNYIEKRNLSQLIEYGLINNDSLSNEIQKSLQGFELNYPNNASSG